MKNTTFCPKCPSFPLVEKEIHGIKVHVCEKCGGLWLNRGELNSVVLPIEGDLEYCTTEHFAEDRFSGTLCPACPGTRLVKVNFVSYSDIIMEYCAKCGGLWLDRGELDAINAEIERINKVPDTWEHAIMVFLSKLPF